MDRIMAHFHAIHQVKTDAIGQRDSFTSKALLLERLYRARLSRRSIETREQRPAHSIITF